MYKIGEFSVLAKLTVKALRFYDETGLLKPFRIDNWTGYRYYTTDQLFDVQKIAAYRQAGLSIDEIRKIMNGASVLEILEYRKAETVKCRADTERKMLLLDDLIKKSKEDRSMEYQAIIKKLPDYTVYYKRGKVRDFSVLTDFILSSAEECRAANPDIKCVSPDYCYITYLDGEFRETDIAVEYAQAVIKAGAETDTIKFRRLEPTDAVCVYHKGSYTKLGSAYAFAFEFIKNNGFAPIEMPRERYIDGVWNKDREDEYLTEIQIPVGKPV